MRYLVDSDWLIDAVGGIPLAVSTLARLSAEGLAVSIIAVAEVYEGAFGLADPEITLASFREFLSDYTTLPLSDSIVERIARLRASLRREGQLIPDMDLLIASTAMDENLVLVTRSQRHFARVPGLRLHEEGPLRR